MDPVEEFRKDLGVEPRWEETAFGNFYHEDFGIITNDILGTAGKWWGWPRMASACEEDRKAGLWPMGPFDSATAARAALEKFADA